MYNNRTAFAPTFPQQQQPEWVDFPEQQQVDISPAVGAFRDRFMNKPQQPSTQVGMQHEALHTPEMPSKGKMGGGSL